VTPPRGRYAPSPSGEIHLGNASTALLAWLSVRARGGSYVLRLEDLDAPRVQPGAADRILADLAWLGLDWDEGWDVGGPHAPYVQSARTELYDDAFRRLKNGEFVYPCFCSRKDVAAAARAPQAPGDEVRYPGTCRELTEVEVVRRRAAGRVPSWRFRVPDDAPESFVDLRLGTWCGERPGDFVVRRADGVTAYQLAVVVDDAAMEIDEVVRGEDLLASTLKQILLYDALGLRVPAFGHVPLWLGEDGVRLSKRHRGTSIREVREAGSTPEEVVGRLAARVGLIDRPEPVAARELVGEMGTGE
jgi:glutamyl-tRNA synthetase